MTGSHSMKGAKDIEGDPSFVWKGLLWVRQGLILFYFEFEYRTSRTIKRDTNSGMSETKCMKTISSYQLSSHKNLPATLHFYLSWQNAEVPWKFTEVPRSVCVSLVFAKRGGSAKFRGSSAICSWPLQLQIWGGIYSPLRPNGHFFFSTAPKQTPLLLSHSSFDSHQLESKIQP